MNSPASSTINLAEIYSKLLWKAIKADPGQIGIGSSSFEPEVASFEFDPVSGAPLVPDAAEYGLVAEISSGRFLSLASFNPLEEARSHGPLRLPTLYLCTDDERKSMWVELAGGVPDILRFRQENGDQSAIPVILFLENNHHPVRACEMSPALLKKLDYGIYARHGDGRADAFVAGCSFSGRHIPTFTSDDYDGYDLSPDQWADAMRRHVERNFGPIPFDQLVNVGEPGW